MSDRTAWNSTLRPGRRPRERSFRERFPEGEDRDRYGFLWEMVRRLPCIAVLLGVHGHRCRPGVSGRHTAHHVGRTDLDGLVPADGWLHDGMDGAPGRTARDVEVYLGAKLADVGALCVAWALSRLGRSEWSATAPEGLERLHRRLEATPTLWTPEDDLAW